MINFNDIGGYSCYYKLFYLSDKERGFSLSSVRGDGKQNSASFSFNKRNPNYKNDNHESPYKNQDII